MSETVGVWQEIRVRMALGVLRELKEQYNRESDEYADISQTMHYIRTWTDLEELEE